MRSVEGCQTVRWPSGPAAGWALGGIGTASRACCRAPFHAPASSVTRTVGWFAGTVYRGDVPSVPIHGPHPAAMFWSTVFCRVLTSVALDGSSGTLDASGAFQTLSGAKRRGAATG